MAAETRTKRRWFGRLLRDREQVDAYSRAALLTLLIAAGLAGLAAWASGIAVTSGTILLFDHEQWPFWLAGLALSGGVGVAAASFALRARPEGATAARLQGASALPTVPLLPAVTAFGGVLLISIYHNAPLIAIAPALLAPASFAGFVARYHLDDSVGRVRRWARTAHVLLTHGVAFLVLATIYINKVRSLLSATTVAVVACLLLAQLADGERFPAEQRLIYGLVGGLTLGEITWALNYWPLTGWTGGAVLLIAFYLIAGLILSQVREGLRRRNLVEYGLGAAVLFAVVAVSLW